jgi:hypothetical protein
MRRALGPSAVGALVFLAACVPPWVHLYSGRGVGDMYLFRIYGHRMMHGLVPYHDFFFDWPPGSVPPVFLAAVPGGSYYDWFHGLIAVYAIAAIAAAALTLVGLGVRGVRLYAAVAAVAAFPFALGAISIDSFDYWPALFTTAGLAALVAGRDRLGFGLLGAGIVAKIYPIVIVPLALVWVWRRRGRSETLRGLGVGVAVVVVVSLPFAAVGLTGLGFSVWTQLRRGLQMESLGASLLMALDRLGVHHVHVVTTSAPYSLDIAGGAATAVGALFTILLVVALVVVYLAYASGADEPQRLVTAAVAAVAGYVAFNRVLSPQYLVWLFPLVPLVAGTPGVVATLLLFAACGLTMTWFPGRFWHLANVSPVSWCVLGRNVLVVLVFSAVVTPLLRSARRPWRETVAALPALRAR